jgi:hypothetical protein
MIECGKSPIATGLAAYQLRRPDKVATIAAPKLGAFVCDHLDDGDAVAILK